MKHLVFILIIALCTGCHKLSEEVPHIYELGSMVQLTDYKLTLDGHTLKNPLEIIKLYPETHPNWTSRYDCVDANGVLWLGLTDETLKPWH